MEERRKLRDRRVNAPRRSAPLHYARRIADRRQINLITPKKHWTEYDIELITRCLTSNLPR
jgi:hypothetical protein